ncbi:MAG: transcriptional repressor [Saccharofermentans sp.]|mgnify:CR=1 FL=1|nr:transcriptional repressor [Saccharofermentans sp.]
MAYKTKHKEELLSYLKSIPGKHVTAGDICTSMKAGGSSIGTATVYRQLENLVSEGLINKYVLEEGMSACYEYIPEHDHLCREHCYHLKCESCGKLIHMECDEVEGLMTHISAHHGFCVNAKRTVFYGTCEECGHGAD